MFARAPGLSGGLLLGAAIPLWLAGCATGGQPAPAAPAGPPIDSPAAATDSSIEADAADQDAEPAAASGADSSPATAAVSPAAAYLEDPAAIVAGRQMFRAVCTGYCHSTTPGITKEAPNLFDCDQDHGGTDADLYRVIAQGVPDTEMLAFGGKIPEDTIWKMIAYIRSDGMDCGQ